MAKRFKVSLTFFKKGSGKFYSSHEGIVVGEDYWSIVAHVRDHHRQGTLPGLEGEGRGFHVVADIDGVPHLSMEV